MVLFGSNEGVVSIEERCVNMLGHSSFARVGTDRTHKPSKDPAIGSQLHACAT